MRGQTGRSLIFTVHPNSGTSRLSPVFGLDGQTTPINTLVSRVDCVQGEKDQIYGNPLGYNQTYTKGTLP